MFAPRDEGGGSSDPRLARLYEPHVEPLTRLISVIRDRAGGQTVPNVDPNDGGINAPALFLPRARWGRWAMSPRGSDMLRGVEKWSVRPSNPL